MEKFERKSYSPTTHMIVFEPQNEELAERGGDRDVISARLRKQLIQEQEKITKWLKKRGVSGKVQWGTIEHLNIIPIACSDEIANLLLDYPGILAVRPNDKLER